MKIDKFSKHIFWSYKNTADLPHGQIIRQVISWGEIEDLNLLTKYFSKEEILNTIVGWKEAGRYAKRIYFMNKVILEL